MAGGDRGGNVPAPVSEGQTMARRRSARPRPPARSRTACRRVRAPPVRHRAPHRPLRAVVADQPRWSAAPGVPRWRRRGRAQLAPPSPSRCVSAPTMSAASDARRRAMSAAARFTSHWGNSRRWRSSRRDSGRQAQPMGERCRGRRGGPRRRHRVHDRDPVDGCRSVGTCARPPGGPHHELDRADGSGRRSMHWPLATTTGRRSSTITPARPAALSVARQQAVEQQDNDEVGHHRCRSARRRSPPGGGRSVPTKAATAKATMRGGSLGQGPLACRIGHDLLDVGDEAS